MNFPKDADGDALRNLAARCDITKPMAIEFTVVVPDKCAAEAVASRVLQRGYMPSIEWDDETDEWSCSCAKRMLPTYAAIVAAQQELDELSRDIDGYSDGWGTFGN